MPNGRSRPEESGSASTRRQSAEAPTAHAIATVVAPTPPTAPTTPRTCDPRHCGASCDTSQGAPSGSSTTWAQPRATAASRAHWPSPARQRTTTGVSCGCAPARATSPGNAGPPGPTTATSTSTRSTCAACTPLRSPPTAGRTSAGSRDTTDAPACTASAATSSARSARCPTIPICTPIAHPRGPPSPAARRWPRPRDASCGQLTCRAPRGPTGMRPPKETAPAGGCGGRQHVSSGGRSRRFGRSGPDRKSMEAAPPECNRPRDP